MLIASDTCIHSRKGINTAQYDSMSWKSQLGGNMEMLNKLKGISWMLLLQPEMALTTSGGDSVHDTPAILIIVLSHQLCYAPTW